MPSDAAASLPPADAPLVAAPVDPLLVGAACIAAAASAAVAVVLVNRLWCGRPLVPWRPHPTVPWSGGDVALVLATYVACAAVASAWLPPDPSLVGLLLANLLTVTGTTLVATVHLLRRGADRQTLGWSAAGWRDEARLAIGGLALLVAPLLALAALLDRIVPYHHPLVDLLLVDRRATTLAVVIVSAVVAAPIAEEFFFRRVLQGWLEARLPGDEGRGAVVASAALFAAAHTGQGLASVPLFLLGLVLGWIARQTGSIVACVVLHAAFNAVSVALVLLTTRPTPEA